MAWIILSKYLFHRQDEYEYNVVHNHVDFIITFEQLQVRFSQVFKYQLFVLGALFEVGCT